MATPVPKWNIRQKTLINNVGMAQQWSLTKKDKKSDVTSSPWEDTCHFSDDCTHYNANAIAMTSSVRDAACMMY